MCPELRLSALMLQWLMADDGRPDLLALDCPGFADFLLGKVLHSVMTGDGGFLGWRTEELLNGLALLATNDSNKRVLIDSGKSFCTLSSSSSS